MAATTEFDYPLTRAATQAGVKSRSRTVHQGAQVSKRAPIRVGDVAPAMEVYTEDGAHLGTVAEVWAATDHGHLPQSRFSMKAYGPIAGTSAMFDGAEGFVEVVKVTGPRLREISHIELENAHGIQGNYLLVESGSYASRPNGLGNRFSQAG